MSAYCDRQPSAPHNHDALNQGPGTHLEEKERERETERGVRLK